MIINNNVFSGNLPRVDFGIISEYISDKEMEEDYYILPRNIVESALGLTTLEFLKKIELTLSPVLLYSKAIVDDTVTYMASCIGSINVIKYNDTAYSMLIEFTTVNGSMKLSIQVDSETFVAKLTVQ